MKQFKRIIAMIMVVAMCAGLAVTASASNVAANQQLRSNGTDKKTETDQTNYTTTGKFDQHKITIAGGDINAVDGVTQNDHNYRAYQIFAGDVNAGTKGYSAGDPTASPPVPAVPGRDELAVTGWGKDVDGEALLKALQEDTTHFQVQATNEAGELLYVDPTDPTKTTTTVNDNPVMVNEFANATGFAGVASVISKWKDGASNNTTDRSRTEQKIDYFAEIVAKNVYPDLSTGGTPLVWNAGTNQYESPLLDEGYYLIKDLGKAADKDDFISKNIIELLGGDANIQPKGTIPTVDKGVIDKDSSGISGDPATSQPLPSGTTENAMPERHQENDGVEANIGDTVYYTLKGTVSSMIQDYDKYYFAFNDKMSKGLDFGTAASADSRAAVGTSVQDIEAEKTAANAQKQAADKAYEDQAKVFYPDATDEADVYNKDDAAIATAQSAVDTAVQTVNTKQEAYDRAVAESTDASVVLAAEQELNDAKEALDDRNAELKAAKDAKTAHENTYKDLKADQKVADDAVAAVTAKENLRNETINKTTTLTDAEKNILKGNMPEEPDVTDTTKYPAGENDAAYKADKMTYDRYMDALNKVNKAGIDELKTNGNIKVYLYASDGKPADPTATPPTEAVPDTKKAEIDPECYTVTIKPGEGVNGGDKVIIEFDDLLKVWEKGKKPAEGNTNKYLEVTGTDYLVAVYSAVVNDNAVIGNPGNKNEVDLEYSRDPSSDEKGTSKSTPNEAVVFTFELDINKIDKNSKQRLNDAGFFLFKTTNKLIDDGNGNTSNVPHRQYANFIDKGNGVYVFNGWTEQIAVPTTFNNAEYDKIIAAELVGADTSDPDRAKGGTELLTLNNGHFEVKGLQSGTYGLVESTVPNGYDPTDRGTSFALTLAAEYSEQIDAQQINCTNDFNPNFVNKYKDGVYKPDETNPLTTIPADSTYKQEEVNAGMHLMYVDAYGTPTNDKDLRAVNPDYGKDGAANATDKWVKTFAADGITPTEYTNDPTEAAVVKMTLKTYKVTKLTLTGEGTDPVTDPENGTGMIDINNSLEVTLPETGGIGTTIFYIVGGILVVGAAVVMITRKRVEG